MSAPRRKVLIPATPVRAGMAALEQRGDVELVSYPTDIAPAALQRLLTDAEAIVLSMTPFGDAEVAAAPRLRAVARVGVGYDAVDVPALTRRGIPLFVTGIANSPSVAELALHFMLALAKRAGEFDALARSGRWAARVTIPLPGDLFGKTLLIVGFGRIGSRLAKVALALGMDVHVYDPYVDEHRIAAAGCRREADLDAALPAADFVSIHCPRSAETLGMFDARRLGLMKPGAHLVNTARGGIIVEDALYRAVQAGALAGAGLDVLDVEPAVDHPLFALPNVLFAPHMAGVTSESMRRMAETTAQNIIGALDGQPNADNVVNGEVLRHR